MKILIDDATVVTSSAVFRKSLVIQDGRITRVSGAKLKPRGVDCFIDGHELLVFPGFFDMHVHLREPGFEYKEDIRSGMNAALHGGFTGIACMANTNPVNDNAAITNFIKCRAAATNLPVDVHPIAAITKGQDGETLVEMGDLKEAGAVAFSDDGRPVESSYILRRAMEYADTFSMPVICHSEDRSLAGDGLVNEGPVALKLGLRGIPREAEILGICRDLAVARMTGAAVHIAHVSTREGLDLIRRAKHEGVRVSCETCPQYFTLTEDAVLRYDTCAKINPPLRTEADVMAVKEALKDGTIDVIASDHAPHHRDEKETEFDKAAFGMIGLQTTVPLTLELVRQGAIDFKDMAEKLSRKPHRILNLTPPAVNEGEAAVLTIVDPSCEWICDESTILSKSKNTPFYGKKMKGRAKYMIKGGRVFEL